MAITESLFAFVDTETGGLIPGLSPVLEIATILTDLSLKEVARFESKISLRKGDVVDPGAARVNGFDPAVWAREGRPFGEYVAFLKRHIPFGSVAIPVGHNVGFDRDMLDLGYFKPARLFCPLSYHKVDTVALAAVLRLSGRLECENLKLGTVVAAMGLTVSGELHRAMADCEASKAIFEAVIGCLRAGVPT